MEIDKEQNIIVRYIPQYIVIETRYKPFVSTDDQQQILKTTSSTENYDCDEKFELANSIQSTNFDRSEDYAEDADDSEFVEFKQDESFETKSVDVIDCKLSPSKRKYDSNAAKLLNDWFLSHLHVSYEYFEFLQTKNAQFPSFIVESLPNRSGKRCPNDTDEYD